MTQCACITGDVINPMDLISYDPSVSIAMQRIFGSMLIAKTDEAAAALAIRFGLSSVTLGGRFSRPGSLHGGWQGQRSEHDTALKIVQLSQLQVALTFLYRHCAILNPLHAFSKKTT